MAKSSTTPTYICWHEADFCSDRIVMRMTPHQRLMYRCLCQVARFCETRPYLPDDDDELYVLADADSLDQWMENREVVLAKFQRVQVDGKPMLAHKRVLSDHGEYQNYLEQKSGAGKASAQARTQRALIKRSTGVQQSNESTESIEMSNEIKKRNSTDSTESTQNEGHDDNSGLITTHNQNPEPQNVTTSNPQIPAPESVAPADIAQNELGAIELCLLFEKFVLNTNSRREARGKKIVSPRPDHWKQTWVGDFQRLLNSGYTSKEIQNMIKYAFGDRWLLYTYRPQNIVTNHHMLAKDLKIPVRELVSERTGFEKLIAGKARKASRTPSGRYDCARRCLEGEVDVYGETCAECKSNVCTKCGETWMDEPGRVCSECEGAVSANEFAREVGATAVSGG